MSATKILWGQVITVFLIVLAGVWGATQWTAAALAYQPELGPPWFMAFGWRVYPPPAFFWWWFSFDAYAPAIFQTGAFIAASGGFVSIAVAIGMSVWRARELKNAETYGSARWASEKEVRGAGLLGPNGVVLGKLARDYLRHDGPEHVLCFAPTRSGKGVGLVVPSLLTWPGSAIVHDIKGENWRSPPASGRGMGACCCSIRPTRHQPPTIRCSKVRRGQWEVRDVQNVADVLVDPEGSLERRNHWEKTSHSLLVGAILHVLYAEADKTLAGVASFSVRSVAHNRADAGRDDGDAAPGRSRRASCRRLGRARTAEQSDNERSGVLSTAMSFLGLYRDPVVAQVTRACHWRISDLVEARRRRRSIWSCRPATSRGPSR
jgi:type IV secretion system protein VirD4